MKIKYLLAFVVGLLACCFFAHAQTALPSTVDSVVTPNGSETSDFLTGLLVNLALTHPYIGTLIAILGSMRVWAKPVFSLVHTFIDATPSKVDDGYWAKIYGFLTGTPSGRFLSYCLDWFASIKLTQPVAAISPVPAVHLDPTSG